MLTPSAFLPPGTLLAGKYRVERPLGEGAMGLVVAARHVDLDELRAVKLMRPSMLGDAEGVERFLREARAAVRLRSQHVCKVIDVGRLDGGAPYIVMEYLEGTDLKGILEARGPLPVPEAINYLLQACEALAEAHAVGIIPISSPPPADHGPAIALEGATLDGRRGANAVGGQTTRRASAWEQDPRGSGNPPSRILIAGGAMAALGAIAGLLLIAHALTKRAPAAAGTIAPGSVRDAPAAAAFPPPAPTSTAPEVASAPIASAEPASPPEPTASSRTPTSATAPKSSAARPISPPKPRPPPRDARGEHRQ